MIPKRIIALLCFLLGLIPAMWADTDKSLIVESKDGSTISFLLKDSPVLTFSNRSLWVTTNTKMVSFEIDNVEQYYFELTGTNISTISNPANLRFWYTENGNVVVEGFKQPAQAKLFSVSGIEYTDRVTMSGDRAEVALSSLQKGVYIISVNNQQIKVYKK